jgi:hypothetical protein
MGCGLAAGRLRDVRRFGGRFSGRFSGLGSLGRHSLHFSISFSEVQHFHTGHERAVNDSKPAFRDFLHGCQLVAVTLITVRTNVIRMANRPGLMRAIKGNIGATRRIAAHRFFSPQARRSKEDARSSALAEKDLTFYVKRFL